MRKSNFFDATKTFGVFFRFTVQIIAVHLQNANAVSQGSVEIGPTTQVR